MSAQFQSNAANAESNADENPQNNTQHDELDDLEDLYDDEQTEATNSEKEIESDNEQQDETKFDNEQQKNPKSDHEQLEVTASYIQQKFQALRQAAEKGNLSSVTSLLTREEMLSAKEHLKNVYPVFQYEEACSIVFGVNATPNNQETKCHLDTKDKKDTKEKTTTQNFNGIRELLVNLLFLAQMLRDGVRLAEERRKEQNSDEYRGIEEFLEEDKQAISKIQAQIALIKEIAKKNGFHSETPMWGNIRLKHLLNGGLNSLLFVNKFPANYAFDYCFSFFPSFRESFTTLSNPLVAALGQREYFKALELLKDENIRKVAADDQNAALSLAVYFLPVLRELLKIPEVIQNAEVMGNEPLRRSVSGEEWFAFLELLQIPKVRRSAILVLTSMLNNNNLTHGQFDQVFWAIIIKLMKTKSVRGGLQKSLNSGEILNIEPLFCRAIMFGDIPVLQAFQQIPAVNDTLTKCTSLLRVASENKEWLTFLELLAITEASANVNGLGLSSVDGMSEVCELVFQSIQRGKAFGNDKVAFGNEADKKEETEQALMKLLENKSQQEMVATTANLLVLQFAAMKGYSTLLNALLEIKTERNGKTVSLLAHCPGAELSIAKALRLAAARADMTNIQVLKPTIQYLLSLLRDDKWNQFQMHVRETIDHAVYSQHWAVACDLLELEGLTSKGAHPCATLTLFSAIYYNRWETVLKLCKTPQVMVRGTFAHEIRHELHAKILLLLEAIETENIPVTCEILKAFKKFGLPIPNGIKYKFEGKEHPIETLLPDGTKSSFVDEVKSTRDTAMTLMNSQISQIPPSLCTMIVTQYAALTPDLADLTPLSAQIEPFTPLLLSRGPFHVQVVDDDEDNEGDLSECVDNGMQHITSLKVNKMSERK